MSYYMLSLRVDAYRGKSEECRKKINLLYFCWTIDTSRKSQNEFNLMPVSTEKVKGSTFIDSKGLIAST